MEHLDELGKDRVRAGDASPEEMQHGKECLQCMVEVEVIRFMANAMKDAQAIEVPAEVDRAILASMATLKASGALQGGASPSGPCRRPVWALFAGSAAAAVLAVAITLTFVAPAHADVVDAYALALKGGNPAEILGRCTKIRSPRKATGNRFVAVDVYVEAGDRKLAAWQVEIDTDDRAAIVGVEGGEPAAYSDPPTYDPAALQGGKIILAAFTTGDAPSGRVRVARLHLMESAKIDLDGKVTAAAAPGGKRFDAKLALERMGDNR